MESEDSVESAIARLEDEIRTYNELNASPYKLSISVGFAFLAADEKRSVEELMAQADKAMYENKRKRKANVLQDEEENMLFINAVA